MEIVSGSRVQREGNARQELRSTAVAIGAIGGLVKVCTVNHTPTKPPNWFVNRESCEEVIYGWLKLIVQAGNRSMYFPHRKAKF